MFVIQVLAINMDLQTHPHDPTHNPQTETQLKDSELKLFERTEQVVEMQQSLKGDKELTVVAAELKGTKAIIEHATVQVRGVDCRDDVEC